jgi:VWA domain-containing protein
MRRSIGPKLAILIAVAVVFVLSRRERETPGSGSNASAERTSAASRKLDEALAPDADVKEREGLAAAILIDVSGSMQRAPGEGKGTAKIVEARRAAVDLVDQFSRYAEEHKDEPVLLGVYEFSGLDGQPDCREVIPMGPPDRSRAAAAIAGMRAAGGTPIGNAMITGKRALDKTGLSRRHLLVVTDGENTNGPSPEDVAAAITRRPSVEQPSIYFVAFDVSASRFDSVRNAGGLVLEAANAKALNDTLDSLLRGKILIEK